MKQIVLMSFNSIQEGINFMNNFQYPCSFTVKRSWDKWYDKNGSILENIEEQKLPNLMLPNPEPYIHCLTTDFVDNEYCYDGDYIFITRNKNN